MVRLCGIYILAPQIMLYRPTAHVGFRRDSPAGVRFHMLLTGASSNDLLSLDKKRGDSGEIPSIGLACEL